MDGGGGVNTYTSVASGLLGVLAGCFLATHCDGVLNPNLVLDWNTEQEKNKKRKSGLRLTMI